IQSTGVSTGVARVLRKSSPREPEMKNAGGLCVLIGCCATNSFREPDRSHLTGYHAGRNLSAIFHMVTKFGGTWLGHRAKVAPPNNLSNLGPRHNGVAPLAVELAPPDAQALHLLGCPLPAWRIAFRAQPRPDR